VADAVKVFLLTLSALFPIVDPLAGRPIFLAMTPGYSAAMRRALAWRVALNSLALMVGSYFIGAHVLNFFGVSLPVVQVGGGLIVASMGWSMLLEREDTHDTTRKSVECCDALHSAFYRLTLPLTVGPGTSPLPSPWAQTPRGATDSTSSSSLQRSSPWPPSLLPSCCAMRWRISSRAFWDKPR